jgi:hypothetical protein
MNILHLYDESNPLIAKHVKMLSSDLNGAVPDIVHVHGCWQYHIVRQAIAAHRQGARIVFTPHGGLEPWIINERRLSEKLAKTLLWQRRMVDYSYVVIVHGNMEAEAMRDLGWNPRIEVIRNAVVTNSITPEAMLQHTQEVYRKVMDSNTLELMAPETRLLMKLLLKAGITGDKRWVTEQPPVVDEQEWRRMLIYANHEHVRTIVDTGTRILGIHHPYIETENIKSYLPTNYALPKVEARNVVGIVGEMHRGPLTLRHFVELDRALRRDDVDDERLKDAFEENRQLKYFRRLLQVLTEVTGLDEGFLPSIPVNDRQTQAIRNQLTKHLRI